ncbi:MAG: hypothetical protein H7338_03950, partial [Candidatus Sericytochromatia bacterium]|nr:hypothetical protein [Candidatus Sericytochromatia bacterium]
MKKVLAIGFIAATLLVACDPPGTTPPSTQSSPKPAASAAPTPTASAPASTPVTPGTSPLVAGRKWAYGLVTKAAGTNLTGDITIEVASVANGQATIKTTSTIAGATTSNSATVSTTANNPWANVNGNAAASTP